MVTWIDATLIQVTSHVCMIHTSLLFQATWLQKSQNSAQQNSRDHRTGISIDHTKSKLHFIHRILIQLTNHAHVRLPAITKYTSAAKALLSNSSYKAWWWPQQFKWCTFSCFVSCRVHEAYFSEFMRHIFSWRVHYASDTVNYPEVRICMENYSESWFFCSWQLWFEWSFDS